MAATVHSFPWWFSARAIESRARFGVHISTWMPLSAVTAGLTAGMLYLVSAVPQIGDAAVRLGLTPQQTSSWLFIGFFMAGAATLVLSLYFRQPLAIGWSLPLLVLTTSGGLQYPFSEVIGATIVAGLLVVGLGLLGVGDVLLRLVPTPIVMGMFAGTVLNYTTGIVPHLSAEPWPVGASLAAYFAARAVGRSWLPPLMAAAIAGAAVSYLGGEARLAALSWQPPSLVVVAPSFSLASMLSLSLPMLVLILGDSHLQGLSFLAQQGFRPPSKASAVVVGLNSIIQALLGGNAASLQRVGLSIVGGPEAGPRQQRYVASVVAGLACLLIAAGAGVAGSFTHSLPVPVVATLAGLAVLPVLIEALRSAVNSEQPIAAFVALAIAASPLPILGVGTALWALLGGLLVGIVLRAPRVPNPGAAPPKV